MGRTVRTLGIAILQSGPVHQRICSSCLRNIQRRTAVTATATAPSEPAPSLGPQHSPPVITSTAPHQKYTVKSGVVLSRPPVITRDLTPFEKAFYLYQRRLNERLALNFTRYFYFPENTPQERDWKRKVKDRITPARDIGKYRAHGPEGWNDELLLGAQESEPSHQWEALLEDATIEVEEEGQGDEVTEKKKVKKEVERPQSRVTEADKLGDMRSLNRALQRTLYLLVKNKDGKWEFPSDRPDGRETLHRAAERILVQSAGPNMNTWLVSRTPIGWHKNVFKDANWNETRTVEYLGEKTFFIKGRIMAGQADLTDNSFGHSDFKWLAKEEVRKEVAPSYWHSVKNMLVEQ